MEIIKKHSLYLTANEIVILKNACTILDELGDDCTENFYSFCRSFDGDDCYRASGIIRKILDVAGKEQEQ